MGHIYSKCGSTLSREGGLGHHCSLRDTARNLLHWMRQFHQNHRYLWIETDMQWILLWWTKTQVAAGCVSLLLEMGWWYPWSTNDTFFSDVTPGRCGTRDGPGYDDCQPSSIQRWCHQRSSHSAPALKEFCWVRDFLQSLNSFNAAANLGLNSINAALHHSVVLQIYTVFLMVIVRRILIIVDVHHTTG